MKRYFIIFFKGQHPDNLERADGSYVHKTLNGQYVNRNTAIETILAVCHIKNVNITNIIEVSEEEHETFIA